MRIEICIDANDVELLASFWQLALGYRRGSGDGAPYLNLIPAKDSDGPIVFLQRVPEQPRNKNRIHIDVYAPDAPALIDRLVEAGGTRIDEPTSDGKTWWQIMADPEGNTFCVMREKVDLQEHFRKIAARS
jgi:predicted enzyme related to lactoylglutathione lyase